MRIVLSSLVSAIFNLKKEVKQLNNPLPIAGAQFGTVISMPLSGLLSRYGFAGGWPSIFYVFGAVGAVWSLAFLFSVYESPDCHPSITESERKHINDGVWGGSNDDVSELTRHRHRPQRAST